MHGTEDINTKCGSTFCFLRVTTENKVASLPIAEWNDSTPAIHCIFGIYVRKREALIKTQTTEHAKSSSRARVVSNELANIAVCTHRSLARMSEEFSMGAIA